jgi:iron complex transport system permease protein
VQTVSRVTAVCAALVLLALAAFVVSLMSGSVEMSLAELWRGLRSSDALSHTLVFELRLPRTLTAFAAGGVLALAGVLMQVLLRNPLADPFIMGVSGGAAVAALSAMLLGMSGLLIDVSATLGALGRRLDRSSTIADGCGRGRRRERCRQHAAQPR